MHSLKPVPAQRLGTAEAELLFIAPRSTASQRLSLLSCCMCQRHPVQKIDHVRRALLPTVRT